MEAVVFKEDLTFDDDKDKEIIRRGGCDCGYSVNTLNSVVTGTVTIGKGRIVIDHFVIQ